MTQSLRGRLLSDSVRYGLAKVLPTFSGVAVVVVASRVFSAAQFGRYSLVLATSVLLGSIGYGWLRQSILRFLPRYQRDETVQVRSSDILALALLTTGGAGVLAVPILLSQGYPVILSLLGAMLVLAFVAFRHVGTVLQADLNSREYVVLTSLQAVVQLGLLLALLIPVLRTIEILIFLTVVSYLLAVGLAIRFTRTSALKAEMRWPDWGIAREYLAYGLPMAGWFFMSQVLNVGDHYVIQWARGAEQLGIYAAGYTVASKTFAVMTMPVLLAMHPLIMKTWEDTGDPTETGQLLAGAAKLYSLGTLPLIAYFFVASDVIVQVALGPEFWPGASVMGIVAVGFWFSGIAQYAHKGLELAHRTGTMFVAASFAATANILLNILLVPGYGYMAAAYTTVASMGLYLVIVRYLARRHLRWTFPWAAGVRMAASAGVAAVPTLLVLDVAGDLSAVLRLVVSFGCYSVAYLALLLATRVLTPAQVASAMEQVWRWGRRRMPEGTG